MYDIPEMLIMPTSEQAPIVTERESVREIALEECVANYEEAIRLSQAEVKGLEKEVKATTAKLNKLIKIVKNNVKKPDVILNQI